jgi:hypothetical protein
MERPKFPKPYIYIFNSTGCHGHYLVYLIDRLSNRTPEIKQLPFNAQGNSHNKIVYSDFAEFVDASQHEENKNLKNTNILKIVYSDNILYYERVAMARAGDANRDIHSINNDISFFKTYNKEFYEKIHALYKIDSNNVPKWLLRDAYKMGFLDWQNQGSVVTAKQNIKWIEENLAGQNNIHYTQVDVFFTTEKLKIELQELDEKFDLDLCFNNFEQIHQQFMDRNNILNTHSHTDLVLDAVKRQQDIPVPTLDIIQQAYVYAKLEQQYDFITMPITDSFFATTKEILDYVKMYPEHYKAMNPNLPKFNNIDNPFFLHRQNRK